MWWVLLAVLGAGWVFPVIGMKKAGCPWWVFLCMAGLWFLVFVVAEPLYDWGVRLRRKLGLVRLAELGERMKPRVLPPARLALLLMALISLVACFL